MQWNEKGKKTLLIHATIWMDLKAILAERKKSVSKGHILYDPFSQHSPNDKMIAMENKLVAAMYQAWLGEGGWHHY